MGLFGKKESKNWELLKGKEYKDRPKNREVHRTQTLERGERGVVTKPVKEKILATIIAALFAVLAFIVGCVFSVFLGFVQFVSNNQGKSFLEFKLDEVPVTSNWWIYAIAAFVSLITWAIANERLMSSWRSRNSMVDATDINSYENDQHIMLPEELRTTYDIFPDVGAHSSVSVSSMLSHMMLDKKGLKQVDVTVRHKKDVIEDGAIVAYKGEPVKDEDGNIKKVKKPIIDTEFGQELFTASGIPVSEKEIRKPVVVKGIEYNPIDDTGSRKDREKLDYDTLDDLINNDWEFPDYEVQRPAGAYVVDTAPVNTMVLAITRAGKGQTVIEPTIDMWTREKRQNNIVVNDPKGELLVKFFVPATVRGYEIVQFNLINPLNTDIYNPLGFAAESAREGDFTKAASYIENIGDIFFPKEGADDPMWPNAANNAFKRSAFGLIDYYLEEEKRIRKQAEIEKKPEKVLLQELDDMWGKVTLYNAYQLFVVLSAKKSVDPEIIKIDEDENVKEKDFLTLFFDATSKLPQNEMRKLVQNTDNALRAMAGSDKTIASVYGIALTAMSFFTDPTISTLTSGKPSQNFDAKGLSFPRRAGVRFASEYLEKYKLVGLQSVWSAYEDPKFEKKLDDKKFGHTQMIDREGWARYFFDGKFKKRKNYIKLEIKNPKTNLLIRTFYFELELTFKTDLSGRRYVKDPVLNKKIVRDGALREMKFNKKKGVFVYKDTMVKRRYRDLLDLSKPEQLVEIPAFSQKTVKYSERPKAIFFITPPHLMSYAKLILILIKQMVDVNFESSYLTKENQKPLYKTRYMLDEVGNLQSEGNGIPALQTMLSIGLGQDQQFTLILQTLQQLRDVYGESVDKIIQGNAMGLDALVATPTGWVRNGDLKVGDEVLTPFGTVTTVTGIYPKGVRPVYEVVLRDGSKAESCNEHLWQIERSKTAIRYTGELNKNGKREFVGTGVNGQKHRIVSEIINTDELKARVDKGRQINLPRIEPLAYNAQDLPLDPYVLGVILGDGRISKNGSVSITNSDSFIVNELKDRGYQLSEYENSSEFSILGIASIVRDLGLDGKRSYEKFIPEMYLYGSVDQRLDLLRGLMDTDGYISRSSEIEYVSVSERLAKDTQSLIRSLGGRVNITRKENVYYTSPTQKERKLARNAYRLQNIRLQKLNPFSLPRKASRWTERDDNSGNRVVRVTYMRDEETQCISVADDRHLYITNDYLPTHNTENIVFLKSTDDSMIETLVKMSGTTHESRRDSKTLTLDNDRLVNKEDAKISYTMTTKERPVLQFNDFMFIEQRNSIIIKAGTSPIWNRNETAYPMSWRLFSNQISLPGKKFSLQTIPTNSSAKDFDVRKNQPDFFKMLNKRLEQAKMSDLMKQAFKDAYGLSETEFIRLDQNVVADDIMHAINVRTYNMEHGEQAAEQDENIPEMDEFGNPIQPIDVLESAVENKEVLQEAAKAQSEHDHHTQKRYAGGQISKDDLVSIGGQVNRQLDKVLALAYEDSRQYFEDDPKFRVTDKGELVSDQGELFIRSSVGMDKSDFDALNHAENDPKARVFSEDSDAVESHFEVTNEFIKYLASLDSWHDLARGRFDQSVSRAYQMKIDQSLAS